MHINKFTSGYSPHSSDQPKNGGNEECFILYEERSLDCQTVLSIFGGVLFLYKVGW